MFDIRGNLMIHYFGDDGSTFQIGQGEPSPTATIPLVNTTTISNIAQTTATGGGNVTSDGGVTVIQRGVVWSTSPNPTTAGDKTIDGMGTGVFVSSLIGLLPSTTYYYRAYAINAIDVGYGEEFSFITAAVVIIPTITTRAASSATQTTIVNTGGININVPASVDFYKVEYKPTGTTSWSATTPVGGPLGVDNYTTTITGLVANNGYDYRAHMVVGGNVYTGNTLMIHTLAITPVAPIVTGVLDIFGQTTASINGNVTSEGTQPVTARGTAWGLAPNPTIAGSHTTDGSGLGSFVSSLSGLVPNTTYYFKTYATSFVDTSYSAQGTFTTIPLVNVDVCLFRTFTMGINSATGCVCTNPSLLAGQCVGIAIDLDETVCNSGNAIIEVFCKTTLVPLWTLILSLNTSGVQHCGHSSNQVFLCQGDGLCYQQSNTGDAGSWSTTCIHHITSTTPNITATVNPTYHCDRIYT
jgi:hypothetical protein